MNLTQILVSAIALVSIINLCITLTKPRQVKQSTFVFNKEIIEYYEKWLFKSVQTFTTKYIENVTGANLVKDDEISINSEFAINGIEYVNKCIIESIPIFYQRYMIQIYGEDKFLLSIYELVRQVFSAYITKERTKRLHGGSITLPKKEKNE